MKKDGLLLVDKHSGCTSHDIVAAARRVLRLKKIGHCGTLDPAATGLLLLTVGRYLKVTEDEIRDAMRLIIGRHHLLVEGAAAVPVAALLEDRDRLAGRRVAAVLCGANVALATLRAIL